jgi:CheY-like chemotaxis protein
MRLLYVDDDRINTLLFEETCRVAGGIELASATCGSEALELAVSFQPELLVLDLHLPDTTGYELLPALRRVLSGTAPAILCSADEPDSVRQQALAAGFQDCWTKPVELATVLVELARLGQQSGHPA